jgi:hypothetical protein
MSRLGTYALLAGALLGAGVLVGWCARPDPPPRYRNVEVTRDQIEASEPDTVVQFRERIVYRTVEPEQVAVAPGGAVEDVDAFCRGGGFVRADTLDGGGRPDPRLLIRSGSFSGRELVLTGPLSNGDLQQSSYRTRAPFQFRVTGDSVLVQGSRFWWVRPALTGAALLGAGYVAGQLTP